MSKFAECDLIDGDIYSHPHISSLQISDDDTRAKVKAAVRTAIKLSSVAQNFEHFEILKFDFNWPKTKCQRVWAAVTA